MMLAALLVGHMIGDYFLQNDFIANGKHYRAVMNERDPSKRATKLKRISATCLLHVVLYTFACFLATWGEGSWAFYLSIMIPHFIIDRFDIAPKLMGVIGQEGFKKHLAPWSVIVVDNTMHLMCLWVSVRVFYA